MRSYVRLGAPGSAALGWHSKESRVFQIVLTYFMLNSITALNTHNSLCERLDFASRVRHLELRRVLFGVELLNTRNPLLPDSHSFASTSSTPSLTVSFAGMELTF